MYNIKKRFGTIYNKDNMTQDLPQEVEETVISFENQIEKLADENDKLKKINNKQELRIKELEEENILLKQQNEMYKDIIERDKIKNNEKEKRNIEKDLSNSNSVLNEINNSVSNITENSNKFKTTVEDISVNNKNKKNHIDIKIYDFENICNIPLPPVTEEEEIILNPEENIESVKVIKEVQVEMGKFFEEHGLKDNDDLVNAIKTAKTIKEPMPTPSNSNDKKKNTSRKEKHKFENKDLPILKRCNVVAYKFNSIKDSKKTQNLEILDFIASEHKVMIRFNSAIAEKFDVNDKKIWDDIFKFKIENGELLNNNKTQFKYKVIRCKELYDLYGEDLSRFQIYVNYIGKLKPSEWIQFLEEFDKLFKETIIGKPCSHKYKNGKICNRIDCKVKHKENI